MSAKHTPGAKIAVRHLQEGPVDGMWSVVLAVKDKVYAVTLMTAGDRIGAHISTSYWLHSRNAKSARPCTRNVKEGPLYDALRRAAIDAAIASRQQQVDLLRKAVTGGAA